MTRLLARIATTLATASALALALAGPAQAQAEIIIDNGTAAFGATGSWPTSTAVPGYYGANYQTKEPNGPPPGAAIVDNTDAGFSVTGTWTASTAVSGFYGSNYQHHFANGEPPSAIVADNASGSFTGTWPASTAVGGYYGTNYQTHAAGTGANVFTWTVNVATAGTYEVYARWTSHPNRATNAKYTVNHAGGATVATVNQEQNSGSWVLLGTFSFNAGANTVSLSDDANEYVIADAVKLQPPGAAPNTATWTIPVAASGTYNVYARWTAHPNRATDAKYTVNHAGGASTVTANQEANSGSWNLLGTYTFNAGSATVTLTDQANGYVIADAIMMLPPNAPPNTATWTPNVPSAGSYQVYARWTANPNRATDAKYTVVHAGGSTTHTVDQQTGGGAWNLLGTYAFAPGTAHKVELTDQANGYVVADAIRLVATNVAPTVSITAPAANAVFNAGATVAITANAADTDGTVTQVEFFANGSPVGTATASPYTVNWTPAAGAYSLTAVATDNNGATTTSAAVAVTVNALPGVSITSPAANATFTAPASITLTATASDPDGTIAQVQDVANGSPIGTATTSPYTFNWTGVAAGAYSLTAVATDNLGATMTSAAVPVTVTAVQAKLYFIHTDHLNTPRQIYDEQQQLRWRWDQAEPFGTSPSNENPAALGAFSFPLRLPGQYADAESGIFYNHFRDYDSTIGRYVQSDPIGLDGGLNTYAYAASAPMMNIDPRGLFVLPAVPIAVKLIAGATAIAGTAVVVNDIASTGKVGDIMPAPANDSYCPPEDPCEKRQKELQLRKEQIRFEEQRGFTENPNFNARRAFDVRARLHNRQCPKNQVEPFGVRPATGS